MSSQEQGQLPMPQIVDAPEQQAVCMQVPVPAGSLVPNFAHKTSLGFGICQIVLGIILILLGIVNIVAGGYLSIIGVPIWCGIFIIVTGSLGIVASRRKTKRMIIATLTCCIIAASLSGGLVLPMSLTTTVFEALDYEVAACVVDAIITLVALVECVIAIIHSVVCCQAVCCGQQQMIPIYYRVQGEPDTPMQPMATPVGAQRTMFMMPLGVTLTGQNAGYQGPPSEQFQYYNPQGQYPKDQLNISQEQIMYTEQRPSIDSKPSR